MKMIWKYESVPSRWGAIAVVWRAGGEAEGEKVAAIILPDERGGPEQEWKRRFPRIVRGTSETIRLFRADLKRALAGEAATFSLEALDLDSATAFARKALAACFQIPRGAVVSYGELAGRIGSPRGARAVGRVMARNPFPIVIPCHRVVRGDGTLGGYGGGLAMKEELLAREGWQAPATASRASRTARIPKSH